MQYWNCNWFNEKKKKKKHRLNADTCIFANGVAIFVCTNRTNFKTRKIYLKMQKKKNGFGERKTFAVSRISVMKNFDWKRWNDLDKEKMWFNFQFNENFSILMQFFCLPPWDRLVHLQNVDATTEIIPVFYGCLKGSHFCANVFIKTSIIVSFHWRWFMASTLMSGLNES